MPESFFHDLFSGTEQDAQEKQKKFEQERDADVAMYKGVLLDPNASPEQRSKAADQISKLRNLKKGDSPYQKLADFLNHVGKHVQSKQSPAPDAATAEGGNRPSLSPLDTNTQQVQQKSQGLGSKVLTKAAHGLGGALGVAGEVLGGSNRTPSLPPLDTNVIKPNSYGGKKVNAYVGKDGREHTVFQRANGEIYETVSEGEVRETGSARPVYGPPMSVRNARDLAKQGMEFIGEDGKPIDIQSLPDEMGLKRFTLQGKTVWVPFSPNQKVITVGNEEYAINPADVSALTQGSGTDLGQKNVGSTNLPGYVGIDQNNQVQRVPGQRTPGTTGVKRGGGLTPLETPTAQPSQRTGGASGTRSASGKASQKTASLSGRPLPLPAGTWSKQAEKATGVTLAQDSLDNFRSNDLDVFDNPESVEKLKNIIGYIQKTADQQLKTGQGPFAAAEWWVGLPTTINQLQQQAMQDQAIQLSPKEQQALADYFRLLGTWGGMRKAIGMSPARWSLNTMFYELPTPGVVNSAADAEIRFKNLEGEAQSAGTFNPLLNRKKSLPSLDSKQSETKRFRDGGHLYNIPAAMVGEFKKDHPKAQAVQ